MQHPEEHDITALAYGLIEGVERDSLLTHLAQCDACRAVYDACRDEQAGVREAIVRDARSGAAEAKALDNTLRMLSALEADASAGTRGRLLRLPRWVLVAEIAAVLAVAVGLFFIIKPDHPGDEVLPVAALDRAPAEVQQGVVYMRDTEGDWKPAEALPMDEWVMAGEAGQLSFTLTDGSRAQLEQGSVFRIALENGEAGAPVVIMLHGKGELDSAVVRAGDTGFYSLPGARIRLECEAGEVAPRHLRAWSSPNSVNARVLDGDVVLQPGRHAFGYVPLRHGETVEWDAERFQVIEADGGELPIGFQLAYARDDWSDAATRPTAEALRMQLERVRPRFVELDKLMREYAGNQRLRLLRLHADMQELGLFLPGGQLDMKMPATAEDVTLLFVDDAALWVSTDSKGVSAALKDDTGSVTYRAATPDDLRELLPVKFRAQLDGVKFTRDGRGRWRVSGDHADPEESGSPQANEKIVRDSNTQTGAVPGKDD